MRYLKMVLMAAVVAGFALPAHADNYTRRDHNSPDVEVWTNKGYDSRYYYGEDIAVYFRAESDCYVVVYDIDPAGEVTVLYPSNYNNSAYVRGGEVYRIPDYYSDFTLEVTERSGTEHIFAIASFDYLEPPNFMRYVGYDYGDPGYYDDDNFIFHVRGDFDDFTSFVNNRIAGGPCTIAHSRFHVDSGYRHHRHYRYWDYDPYYNGSVWIGCNFVGAEVWIDGVYFGIAPLLIPHIYIGEHWCWIYYGGFPCYQQYFFVSAVDRYYIDVRIDDHYKDYRYRRTSFGDWRPYEKKYRNENDFKDRAREARESKSIRARALPARVVRDLDERGIISKDAPIVKKARAESRTDDGLRMSEKRKVRKEIDRQMTNQAGDRIDREATTIVPPDKRESDDEQKKTPRESYRVSPEKSGTSRDAEKIKGPENKKDDSSVLRKDKSEGKKERPEKVKSRDRERSKQSDSGLKKSDSESKSRSKADESSRSRSSDRRSSRSSSERERRR